MSRLGTLLVCVGALGCQAAAQPSPDAKLQVLPLPEHGQQVVLDAFRVNPGEEGFFCQVVTDLFDDDVIVREFEVLMPTGAHHMIAAATDHRTAFSLRPHSCAESLPPNELGESLFWTAEASKRLAFPDGIGLTIQQHRALAFDLHFVNATDAPIEGRVVLNLHFARDGEVTTQAGVYSLVDFTVNVPPHTRKLEQHSCTLGFDVHLLSTRLHMHSAGQRAALRVLESVGTQRTLATTSDWDDAPWVLFPFPGELLTASDALQWECDYDNTSDRPLIFGSSNRTAAMCNAGGYFYPAREPGELVRCSR